MHRVPSPVNGVDAAHVSREDLFASEDWPERAPRRRVDGSEASILHPRLDELDVRAEAVNLALDLGEAMLQRVARGCRHRVGATRARCTRESPSPQRRRPGRGRFNADPRPRGVRGEG